MVTVRLDAALREFLPRRTIESQAASVEGLLDDLEQRFPKLRHRLRDETRAVRRYVRVFVNGVDIRGLDGPRTRVGPADAVDVLHSIQGG